jgi:hypothetical protein
MKSAYWVILALLVLLGYTGYVGIVAPPNLTLEQPEIILKANAGQGKLEPQNSHKCAAGDKPGCVQFDKNTLGTITFRIQNGPKDTNCNTPPKPQWVITKVELTADELPPAGSGKGDYSKPIPAWLSDAFPQINSLTGVVYEASLNFGTSSAVIVDLNNNEGEKIIYYKVTATSCLGGNVLVTDPMVRNEGE